MLIIITLIYILVLSITSINTLASIGTNANIYPKSCISNFNNSSIIIKIAPNIRLNANHNVEALLSSLPLYIRLAPTNAITIENKKALWSITPQIRLVSTNATYKSTSIIPIICTTLIFFKYYTFWLYLASIFSLPFLLLLTKSNTHMPITPTIISIKLSNLLTG